MLKFKEIEVQNKDEMDKYLQSDGVLANIRTFATLFIWAKHYKTVFAIHEDTLFIRSDPNADLLSYVMPLGSMDLKTALLLIDEDAKQQNRKYKISFVTKEMYAKITEIAPDRYAAVESRDEFDYIYNSEDLIGLKGKNYHGKRNFINRFKTLYNGRWEYFKIGDDETKKLALDFSWEWCKLQQENESSFEAEVCAVKRALENFEALDMRGGLIKVDGKVCAFTLATPQNERIIDIHIEKGHPDIEGAYQMINNQFAMRECSKFEYINREEDMGLEGLRRAKMSYHPAFLSEHLALLPVEGI